MAQDPADAALAWIALVAAQHGVPLTAAMSAQVVELFSLVAQGQTHSNLVGDASPHGVAEHAVEALTVVGAWLQLRGQLPTRIADVGAGAGLSALTLALALPTAHVVAIEPRKLRAQFIEQAAATLGLGNLRVVATSLHSAGLAADIELASARAVWAPPEWLHKAPLVLAPQGLAAVHGKGPGASLRDQLAEMGQVQAVAEVPGPRGNAIALVRPKPSRK